VSISPSRSHRVRQGDAWQVIRPLLYQVNSNGKVRLVEGEAAGARTMQPPRWLGVGLLLALLGAVVFLSHASSASSVRTVSVGTWPWAVAIDPKTGYAFVVDRSSEVTGLASGLGRVSIVDTRSGSVLRTVAVGPDPRAVTVDERTGRILVANDDDASVSVLDAHTGARLTTIRVGARPHGVAADTQTGRIFVVNSGEGTVSVVDARREAVLHRVALPEPDASESVVVDAHRDRIFIAGANTVAVLDARSGRLHRTIPVDLDSAQMAVDVRSGQVFVSAGRGLRVLDPRTGQVLRRLALGGLPAAVAVDSRRRHVLVVNTGAVDSNGVPLGAGSVRVLDARSGVVLRTVAVGVAPIAVAVDERSGRAVVVNAGGAVHIRDAWGQALDWLRRWLPFVPLRATEVRTVPGSVSIVDASG